MFQPLLKKNMAVYCNDEKKRKGKEKKKREREWGIIITWNQSLQLTQKGLLPKCSTFTSVTKEANTFITKGSTFTCDLQISTNDTFAPVVHWSTIRLFLTLSMLLQWDTNTINFSQAFVQVTLKDPVWIHLPQGFHSNSDSGTNANFTPT